MDLSPSHKNILTETIHIHQLNNWTTQLEVESDIHKIKFSHSVSTPNLCGSQIPNQGNLISIDIECAGQAQVYFFLQFLGESYNYKFITTTSLSLS